LGGSLFDDADEGPGEFFLDELSSLLFRRFGSFGLVFRELLLGRRFGSDLWFSLQRLLDSLQRLLLNGGSFGQHQGEFAVGVAEFLLDRGEEGLGDLGRFRGVKDGRMGRLDRHGFRSGIGREQPGFESIEVRYESGAHGVASGPLA
jgi:hypothetical protein